uniref:ShKT domain-containing protein n=1 Tax=Pinctada fucata TaxID=50426 RepID=A0A194ALN5_PINFU
MKGITGLILLSLVSTCHPKVVKPRQTGAAIAMQVAGPAIQKLVSGLGDHLSHALFDKDPYTTLMHRTVKLTESGNTVSIHDVETGITITRSGNTSMEALEKATQDFLTTLLEGGYISTHDLHLAPVITSTPVPCGDVFPQAYCIMQKGYGHCYARSHLFKFMNENCYQTCTNC